MKKKINQIILIITLNIKDRKVGIIIKGWKDMILKKILNDYNWSNEVLQSLLIDRTTNRTIIWGTKDYEMLGDAYNSHFPMLLELIIGKNSDVIRPRILKSKVNQGDRTKRKAEVFTPSWVCNSQINLVDKAWFGRENVFNIENKTSWETNFETIIFPQKSGKSWEKYVDEKRLEIACGEAPYLVSRYDSVSGEFIKLGNRIGILDRKMRIVKENTKNEEEWLKWSERAIQSIYGFEFQGDNLFIARKNILATYCDYMEDALHRLPVEKELINIAKIISWNVWQMDALTGTIPYKRSVEPIEQVSLFAEENVENEWCKIKDWRSKKISCFKDILNESEL